MLIYEKDNKLNINFNPSLLEVGGGNPDIQIGENEIKLGDTEITSENVLPTPTNEDVGKVPTVQNDGSYALANAGGGGIFVVNIVNNGTFERPDYVLDKTFNEIEVAYNSGLFIVGRQSDSFAYISKMTANDEDTYYSVCFSRVTTISSRAEVENHIYSANTRNGVLSRE